MPSSEGDAHREVDDKVYLPLSDPTRETRLIRFEPTLNETDTDGPIRCQLIIANLEQVTRPDYHALSYCWGDETRTTQIHVNGQVGEITLNLEVALRRVRQMDPDRLIWADALCINQKDNVEKECQVNIMASIFSKASLCLLWLGNTSDTPAPDDTNTIYAPDCRKAFDLIESLARDEHYTKSENPEADSSSSSVGALVPLMKLGWWHRIWMVQEAIQPPSCLALCGDQFSLPWTTIVRASDNFQKHHYTMCCSRAVSSLKEFRYKVLDIETTRSELLLAASPPPPPSSSSPTVQASSSISRIFHKFQDRGAKDDRDKVFGLLALVQGGRRAKEEEGGEEAGRRRRSSTSIGNSSPARRSRMMMIVANYSPQVTKRDVFVDATLKLMALTGSLDVLLRAREYGRDPGLPSWTPDWTARNDRHRSREMHKWWTWDLHDACAGTRVEFRTSSSSGSSTTMMRTSDLGDSTDDSSSSGGHNNSSSSSNTPNPPKYLHLLGTFLLLPTKQSSSIISHLGEPCQDHMAFSASPEGPIAIDFPDRRWRALMQSIYHPERRYPSYHGLSPSSSSEPEGEEEEEEEETYDSAFARVLSRNTVEHYDSEARRSVYRLIGSGKKEGEEEEEDEAKACMREVRRSMGQRLTYFRTKMINHRFFITDGGLMGIMGGGGIMDVRVGDRVVVVCGGRMPFVVREVGEVDEEVDEEDSRREDNDGKRERKKKKVYEILGEAYVHGIMNGEAMMAGHKEWICLI